jgi:hypothetical protein
MPNFRELKGDYSEINLYFLIFSCLILESSVHHATTHRSLILLCGRGFNNFSLLILESGWQTTPQFLPSCSGLAG